MPAYKFSCSLSLITYCFRLPFGVFNGSEIMPRLLTRLFPRDLGCHRDIVFSKQIQNLFTKSLGLFGSVLLQVNLSWLDTAGQISLSSWRTFQALNLQDDHSLSNSWLLAFRSSGSGGVAFDLTEFRTLGFSLPLYVCPPA